jgi:hypothetical protein
MKEEMILKRIKIKNSKKELDTNVKELYNSLSNKLQ